MNTNTLTIWNGLIFIVNVVDQEVIELDSVHEQDDFDMWFANMPEAEFTEDGDLVFLTDEDIYRLFLTRGGYGTYSDDILEQATLESHAL
jgi:hypothetical protein